MGGILRRAKCAFCTVVLLASTTGVAVARPWTPRAPSVEPKPAHQLRNPTSWPAEPPAPSPIDAGKFQAAYAHLCGLDATSSRADLSADLLKAADAADSDPFTLAALAYFNTKCDPQFHKDGRYGLFGIEPSMYRVPEAPEPPVDRGQLTSRALMDPATSLAAGAALLEMWNARHKELDESFGGSAHRTGVAHFVWGDEVRSSGQEDLILTARRRMIAVYNDTPEITREAPIGVTVVSPLEAPPRVATSGPGDDREGGARKHRGLDIAATLGEPVRSVADGTVIFAGVSAPGHLRKGPIPPDQIARWAHRRLAVGGIYLCIEHKPEPDRVVTCYMHLASYVVAEQDQVKAGQLIGYVGRTGVKISPPHLHFEVRVGDHIVNPVRTLGQMVIPPSATLTHQYSVKAHRARMRKLRAQQTT
ncbi:MAG TPA: M23 family metallopeptidase [Polyangia bacterium]|nr:M23 family metallopeptidase [Polyangia bacterium]